MARSADCDEAELLELFWPFVEKLQRDPLLGAWRECPFPTSRAEIRAAQEAVWYPLPRPYQVFLLGWNGFNVPHYGRVRQEVAFLCCMGFLEGADPAQMEFPEWSDVVRGNSVRCRWPAQPSGMLNFAGDAYGNAYAFAEPTGSEQPAVVYWDHDGCETTRLASSFAEWLNGLPESIATLRPQGRKDARR